MAVGAVLIAGFGCNERPIHRTFWYRLLPCDPLLQLLWLNLIENCRLPPIRWQKLCHRSLVLLGLPQTLSEINV